ncbi:MAG TPA: multidrug effflux MFS transporter [Cyclobacteriaceae bacterium]|nr:multidrug effflux MFS transporter [Cyclobacteriaceae bacterium]
MTRKEHFITILILGALSTVSPFSIDMYLPGFPAIAEDLNTTMTHVQLSLTAYLIGIAVGQLIYGPLLDRYGRRAPMYAGLVVYLIATIGCGMSHSINSLIIMRFFQALGGCAGMVASQTLVRDLFPSNRTAQAFSSITLVIAVSPMIAPTAGGYLTVAFGWQSVFFVLTVVTILILAAVHFVLPEGRVADDTISLKPKSVINNFLTVIKEPQFLIYTLAGGISMSAPFAFIAGSSDVFINQYGVSEENYGWVFAFIASGLIGSSQLNHVLLKKFSNAQLVRYPMIYQTVLGSIMVAGTILGWFNMYSLLAIMFVFCTGQGLVGPNCTALSLAPFTRLTGSAASLLGSYRMAIGGVVTALVGLFHNGSAVPMVVMMAACPVAGLLILTIGKGAVRYHARKKALQGEDNSVLM